MGVELPASVLKLTEPYEMRVYWFEIVECIRKLALTGMPVWFEMGSTAQLTFGLLISFSSFGAYMLLAPYAKEQDDKLAQLCQAQTFFALVSSIILQSAPPESTTNRNMGVLLVILTALPIAVGIAMEFTSGQSEDKRKKLAYKVINKVVRTVGAYLHKKRAERGRRQRAKEAGERVYDQIKTLAAKEAAAKEGAAWGGATADASNEGANKGPAFRARQRVVAVLRLPKSSPASKKIAPISPSESLHPLQAN